MCRAQGYRVGPLALECSRRGFQTKKLSPISERAAMATGTIKWFYGQKGYGVIQPDDGGKDVFVHISAVERAGLGGLNEGQKIKSDVQMDRGKASAGNLSLVK